MWPCVDMYQIDLLEWLGQNGCDQANWYGHWITRENTCLWWSLLAQRTCRWLPRYTCVAVHLGCFQ